jgi:hypothetical protein
MYGREQNEFLLTHDEAMMLNIEFMRGARVQDDGPVRGSSHDGFMTSSH